jgi:hypothetical protein
MCDRSVLPGDLIEGTFCPKKTLVIYTV